MRGLVLDARALLRPIPGTRGGAGRDLRDDFGLDAPFRRLRCARSEARAAERADGQSGDPWRRGAVPGHWHQVIEASLACFAQSRDFDVACWLAEALARLHGVGGFVLGLDVLTGLCDRYWAAGYPEALPPAEVAAGNEWEDREYPIVGLFGRDGLGSAMRPLWLRPLFEADGGPVCLHDLCRALGVPAYRELDRPRGRAMGPDAPHGEPAARAAVAMLARETAMLLPACQALEARLARHLPQAAGTIMPRAMAFAEAVQDVADIVAAGEARGSAYC